MRPLFFPPHPPRVESPETGASMIASSSKRTARARSAASPTPRSRAGGAGGRARRRSKRTTRSSSGRSWTRSICAASTPSSSARGAARRARTHTTSRAQMRAWIDHSEDNLMVLCDVHHRRRGVGIHSLTAPLWSAQPLLEARPPKASLAFGRPTTKRSPPATSRGNESTRLPVPMISNCASAEATGA